MAAIFSKLASVPSAVVGKAKKAYTAAGSLTKAAENINKAAEVLLPTDPLPEGKVEGVLEAIKSVCARLAELLAGITAVVRPFLAAYNGVMKIWDIFVSSVQNWYTMAVSGISAGLSSLFTQFSEVFSDMALITAGVCVTSALSYCASFIGDSFGLIWTLVQSAIMSFVTTVCPNSWFAGWWGGFFPEAQGSTHFLCDSAGKPMATSSGLTSVFCFAISSLVGYFFVQQGLTPASDRNPISKALRGGGDFASKCNQLFQFHKNVKSELGECLGTILDTICDTVGITGPTLSMINWMMKEDSLLTWMSEVSKACDADGRLERFSDPGHALHLKSLLDKAERFNAELTTRPLLSFLAHRYHSEHTRLQKEYSQCISHRGVGQKRDEPFMVYWYGAPGVGKTVLINAYIHDLLDLAGEKETNRIYSLPRADQYWSGYAHQTALLIDDIGAVIDPSGQCADVKQVIDLKSSHPVGLPMADLESKGTHFTSSYIFCTSNLPDAPPDCGLMTPDAFRRRRDIVVNVRRIEPLDASKPFDGIVFDVVNAFPPYRVEEGLTDLSYDALLTYTYGRLRQHQQRNLAFRNVSAGSNTDLEAIKEAVDGIQEPKECQGPVQDHFITVQETLLQTCKYGWNGKFHPSECFSTPVKAVYDSMCDASKEKFHRWVIDMLLKPISGDDYLFWLERVHSDWARNLQCKMIYLKFDISKAQDHLARLDGGLADVFDSEEEDLLLEFSHAPLPTRLALFFLAKHYHETMQARLEAQKPKEEQVWYKRMLCELKERIAGLPRWVKIIMLLCVFSGTFVLMVQGFANILQFLFPSMPREDAVKLGTSLNLLNEKVNPKSAAKLLTAQVANISGDMSSVAKRRKPKLSYLLTQSAATPTEAWGSKDPFVNNSLVNNQALIRFPCGTLVRGLFIDSNWVMTIAHSFNALPEGAQFTVFSSRSKCQFVHSFKGNECKQLDKQDVFFFNIRGACGLKADLRPHFVRKNQFVAYMGLSAMLSIPELDMESVAPSSFLVNRLISTKIRSDKTSALTYGDRAKLMITCARTLNYEHEGKSGECGSALLIPNGINHQPAIVGIHVAGYSAEAYAMGYAKESTVAVVFQEDLVSLLPPPMLMKPQGACPIEMAEPYEKDTFDYNQVFHCGRVPKELAVSVPFATTLRQSPIFMALESDFQPHRTEPAILTARDPRIVKGSFDPYIAGVQKFNETACCFDMEVATVAMKLLQQNTLAVLSGVSVPGGSAQCREEDVILNGIPGELYYDAMDMSTSSGWPFNLGSGGKNKLSHLVGEPGSYKLDRSSPVYTALIEMESEVERGIVPQIVTEECAKDERLPLVKIYQKPKTRLFTILPFHYNMLVRKYFLDFSASLMRSYNRLPCKVGINPLGLDWTNLAQQFLAVNDQGFSADYSSFDGRAPVFLFQWFCDMVDEFYGDQPGSPASLARHALLMAASHHYTLCGEDLFEVVGGMPSGFSLTVIFNSILNEFYMRYAFGALLKTTAVRSQTVWLDETDFSRIFIAVYGDDNLVSVPLDLSWYTLPAIAHTLEKVNVVIKNGMDKTADVTLAHVQHLSELSFLSRGFRQHSLGYYLAPLKEVSVLERLYWVRKTPSLTEVEALEANAVSALEESMHHGEVFFGMVSKVLYKAYGKSSLVLPSLPVYEMVERAWINKIVGSEEIPIAPKATFLPLAEVSPICKMDVSKGVHEVYPNIYVASFRTAYHLDKDTHIMVACGSDAKRKFPCIRGPANFKELQDKVWGFTMGMIQHHMVERSSKGLDCKLLFISSSGDGMALICSALAALATGKYSGEAVLNRFNQYLDFKGVRTYCAGAGEYLCMASGAGSVMCQGTVSGIGFLRGSLQERVVKLGHLRILTGCSDQLTADLKGELGSLWCTSSAGFCGVMTSLSYIKMDRQSQGLKEAIKEAQRFGSPLYLVFNEFVHRHIKWVVDAVHGDLSMSEKDVYAELVALLKDSEDLRILQNPNEGKCVVKRKGCATVEEARLHVPCVSIPAVPTWIEPKELAKSLSEVPIGQAVTTPTMMQLIKSTLVLNHQLEFDGFVRMLRNLVHSNVGPEGSEVAMMTVLHILIWCDNSTTISEAATVLPTLDLSLLGDFLFVANGEGTVPPELLSPPTTLPSTKATDALPAIESYSRDGMLLIGPNFPLGALVHLLLKLQKASSLLVQNRHILVNPNDKFYGYFQQV